MAERVRVDPFRYCPRDVAGFCRIALLGGECIVGYDFMDEPGKGCPESEDEAHAMLVRAAQQWARIVAKERANVG